jgi:hypothetical protein
LRVATLAADGPRYAETVIDIIRIIAVSSAVTAISADRRASIDDCITSGAAWLTWIAWVDAIRSISAVGAHRLCAHCE